MVRPDKFQSNSHAVFALYAHIIFAPKYRRAVLTQRVFDVLRAAWLITCCEHNAELIECNFEGDHVHLLLAYPPSIALSRLIQQLKGYSSRCVRRLRFREVTRELWGNAFWSPSYCVVSCGGAPLEHIKSYVQQQEGAAASSTARPFPIE